MAGLCGGGQTYLAMMDRILACEQKNIGSNRAEFFQILRATLVSPVERSKWRSEAVEIRMQSVASKNSAPHTYKWGALIRLENMLVRMTSGQL